jgi:hypothetical protein
LPPPARCEDAVAGVWRAHHYDVRRSEWYVLTATLKRDPADPMRLTGEIHSHFWLGGPREERPPACGVGYQGAVVQPARGRVESDTTAARAVRLEFGGERWIPSVLPCPPTVEIDYNPDRLSGTIDGELQEFQTLVSDGAAWVNMPVVFRRIQCDPGVPPVKPRLNITPPPLVPAARKSGCGSSTSRP